MSQVGDRWWARDFGCAPEQLRPAKTHVQAHAAGLEGNSGIWILMAGAAPLISLPPDVLDSLGGRIEAWTTADVCDHAKLRSELSSLAAGRVGKIIGPALINYGQEGSLVLNDAGRAVPLPFDQPKLEAFKAASGKGWEQGGSELEPHIPLFGAFDDDHQLAALAGYEVWGGSIAHLSVVTLPDRQRRGLGRAVVALAAQQALATGLVPQYRALQSNVASSRIARRLGFAPYGFSVYVRMSPPR